MSCVGWASSSDLIGTGRVPVRAVIFSIAGRRKIVQWLAVTVCAASLAACAHSPVVSQRHESVGATRQAAATHHRETKVATNIRFRPASRRHSSNENGARRLAATHGMASFYTDGTLTASGEKFNSRELTAAHPTLPFGTRLRVTNSATGKSVTVRVNDRGPYVAGRVVDVSRSAAEVLGMVDKGVANVRLDVVE